MITQLLDQFVSLVQWGDLDYLILDMPPGTGDIQLTLSQRMNITAAVIVTTPQELSFADVVKGIDMFDSVNVPCIAVVENMAYYEVQDYDDEEGKVDAVRAALEGEDIREALADRLRDTGVVDGDFGLRVDELADSLADAIKERITPSSEDVNSEFSPSSSLTNNCSDDEKKKTTRIVNIFGRGHLDRLTSQYGITHSLSVPLRETLAADGDSGTPHVLSHPLPDPEEDDPALVASLFSSSSLSSTTATAYTCD